MEKDVSYLKIFEGPNTDIYYLSNHVIFAIWHGYLNIENVRESGEVILSAAQNFNCHHIMNDNRRILDTKSEALKWIEDEMMPQIVELGIKRVAHIYPYSLIRNRSMDRLLSIQHDSMIKVFSSFADACKWLKGCVFNNLPSESSCSFNTSDGIKIVDYRDIYFLSKFDRKTIVQTKEAQIGIHSSLSDTSEELPDRMFMRVHKSYVVNLDKIKDLKYYAGGYYRAYFKDFGNTYVTVSKLHSKEIKEAIRA